MRVISLILAFAVGAFAAVMLLNGPDRPGAASSAAAPADPDAISSGVLWGVAQLFAAGGSELFQSGRYDQAVEKYTDALLLDDDMPEVYFLRGQSYWRTQRLAEAIADFSSAIAHGSHPLYYSSRCSAYLLLENWDAAIDDCSDAIEMAPKDGGSYVLRGSAYFFKGDLERALADSLVALMIRPGDPNARQLLDITVMAREFEIEGRHSDRPEIRVIPGGTGVAG